MAVIAIDLGGTKLAGAIFDRDGKISGKAVVSLEGRQGRAVGELFAPELTELLHLARAQRIKVSAIGICVPGISYPRTARFGRPTSQGGRIIR